MTVQGQWSWPIDYKQVALEAARDLAARQEDERELARLEDEVANPPTARIVDEVFWYRQRMDKITALKEKLGAGL